MEENKNCCENKQNEKCGNCCSKGCCMNYKRCPLLKWVLLLIIVIIVFSFGVELGELKGEVKGGYHFNKYGGMMEKYNGDCPMMKNWGSKPENEEPKPEVKQ